MPKTIEAGALNEGRSKEREVYQLVNKLRDFANTPFLIKADLDTAATGVLTALWTSAEVPEGAVWRVAAVIIGRATASGPAVVTADIYALFYRQSGGSLTQQDVTYSASTPIATVAGTDADIVVSGNTVVVKVQDDGVRPYSWSAIVTVMETD